MASEPDSGAAWRSVRMTARAPKAAAERRIAPTFCGSVTWSRITTWAWLLPLGRGDHVLDAAVGQGMDLGGQTLVDGAARQPAFQHVARHLLPLMPLDLRHVVGRRPGPGAGSCARGWRGRRLPRDVHTASRVRRAAPAPAAVAPVAHAPAGDVLLGVLSLAPSGVPPNAPSDGRPNVPWPARRAGRRAGMPHRLAPAGAPHPRDAAYVPDLSGNRGTFPVPSRGCGRAACAWSWWPLYSGLEIGYCHNSLRAGNEIGGNGVFRVFSN